ncbi:MAG TPA: hypothetical protein VGC04_12025 [Cellulomonas sp.]
MGGLDLGGWSEFFVAVAGAAAALAGLVIVAISVNVGQILTYPQLPSRAAATVASLVLALLVAISGLAPQPSLAFGIEAAVLGAAVWVLHLVSGRTALRLNRVARRPLQEAVRVIVQGQLHALPVVVGGVLVAAGVHGGLFVVFGGIVAIFALTMLDAWVLLVEILR